MRVRYLSGMLLVAALALAGVGCGDQVKVRGVVTLDGNPIKGAVVTFIPEGGGGQPASGITQKDGSFRLETLKENDGVLPGNYKVTVTYTEGAKATGPPARSMREAMPSQKMANKQKKVHPKYVIPLRYSEPGRTVLRQKVPPDGDVKFDLQSK